MSLSETPLAQLRSRLANRTAVVGVIGLGYVGLPVTRAFANAGFRVLGFDIDPAKVEQLNRGESYIGHISADVVKTMRQQGFEATADFARLTEPDATIICVPTPLTPDHKPDLSFVV